jgi:hypothetical protein
MVHWPTTGRLAVALAWRAAVCYAVFLTAQQVNLIPVFIAATGMGAALVALPLRYFRASQWAAVAQWLVLCTVVPLALSENTPTNRSIITVMVGVTLAAWVVSFARFALHEDSAYGRTAGAVFIAASVFAAFTLIIVALPKLPLGARVLAIPAGASGPLTVMAALAASMAAITAVVAGAVRAVDDEPDQRSNLFRPPRQPGPFRRPELQRRSSRPQTRDLGTIVLRTVANFMEHVGAASSLIARLTVHALRWLSHWIVRVLVSLTNALWRWLLSSIEVVTDGLLLLPSAMRRSSRLIAVPFACLFLAAWLTYLFAEQVRVYLAAGSLYALGALLTNGTGAVLSLTIAWIALSQQPIRLAARSAGLTLSASGANILILTSIGGWTLGLFGTLGHGPIRVGWVTATSTVILVASMVWSGVKNRHRHDSGTDVPQAVTLPADPSVAA